jgi:hypothetical protein
MSGAARGVLAARAGVAARGGGLDGTQRAAGATARQDGVRCQHHQVPTQSNPTPFFLLLREESFIDYRNALARLQEARAGLPQRLTVLSPRYTR